MLYEYGEIEIMIDVPSWVRIPREMLNAIKGAIDSGITEGEIGDPFGVPVGAWNVC